MLCLTALAWLPLGQHTCIGVEKVPVVHVCLQSNNTGIEPRSDQGCCKRDDIAEGSLRPPGCL